MTTTHSRKIQAGYVPIAGYTLEALIGQGGFGEVWRADAPGGIKKAVKFVFGGTEQHRATRELRSLERIKGVQHPFLLTLERFEIVDDQLIIITELADGSLEDVYNRHRERGSCGIPRAAMLAYLHDAADALDYLHGSYQLQHLDIKPGNLLLVGGHVKVADFGLLKDLRDDDCSMIGGLTPIYAPPEVFDGRPSMHSDQYSLAIMYQELLTGTRPFSGRTIAQLATQHVSSSPDLEPLPPSDRPVVAKALEKNPDRRFASCIEFVEALRSPKGRTSVSGVGGVEIGGDTAHRNTQLGGGPDSVIVQDLPQLKTDVAHNLIRVTGHALVISLGGVGADCLHQLRGRVSKLYAASPLDLHSVLIDTDPETIYATSLSELSGIVPPCQTIHTPLRTANEYRHEGSTHLSSVSRRWIYNIPRSKTTEGMRPLGRLALVDHSNEVLKKLRESISHLAAVCGDRTPHIYIVGSISGGTASGMFLDVTHVVRHLLDEAGLEKASVLPVLAMQALRPDSNRPLGIHDSCAALMEMRHFMQPGNSYPGDPGANLPSLPAARSPLRGAYVIASAPQQPISTTVETIVDYIWADTTGAGELLAASRRTDGDEQSTKLGAASLRSFGVARLGGLRALEENMLAPASMRTLFLRWLGRPVEAKQMALPLADRLIRRCGLDAETLHDVNQNILGRDTKAIVLEQLQLIPRDQLADSSAIQSHLELFVAQKLTENSKDQLVASVVISLQRELSARLQDRRVDVTSSVEALRLIIARVNLHTEQLVSELSPRDVESKFSSNTTITGQPMHSLGLACEFGETVLNEIVSRHIAERSQAIEMELSRLQARFEDLATLLARAIHKLNQDESLKGNPWDHMPAEIASRFEATLGHLHNQVSTQWLMRYIMQSETEMNASELVNQVSSIAVKLVKTTLESASPTPAADVDARRTATPHVGQKATEDLNAVEITTTIDSKKIQPLSSIEMSLAKAYPAMLACGGRQRLILIVGSDPERLKLEREVREVHSGALTVAVIPGTTPMLIHEAQQIKMDDVINRISMMAAGSHQVTQRLHSRSDIDWSSQQTRQ